MALRRERGEALDESDGDGSDEELEEEVDLSRARGTVHLNCAARKSGRVRGNE